MFPIVPCIKSHLPRKFHENPFRRFSVMLLIDRQTNRQTRATDNDENITFAMAEVMNVVKKAKFWYVEMYIEYWNLPDMDMITEEVIAHERSYWKYVILTTSFYLRYFLRNITRNREDGVKLGHDNFQFLCFSQLLIINPTLYIYLHSNQFEGWLKIALTCIFRYLTRTRDLSKSLAGTIYHVTSLVQNSRYTGASLPNGIMKVYQCNIQYIFSNRKYK